MYTASCWNCDDFYISKTKRSLHDRKTEHFKALRKSCQASAVANQRLLQQDTILNETNFNLLATGRSDVHCNIKESLLFKLVSSRPRDSSEAFLLGKLVGHRTQSPVRYQNDDSSLALYRVRIPDSTNSRVKINNKVNS